MLFSEKFVDKDRSPSLYRAFYIPKYSDEKVVQASYVIMRNLHALPIVYHPSYGA